MDTITRVAPEKAPPPTTVAKMRGMGIRTFLRRMPPGVARPPVPVFAAAASTVRVPVTPTTTLRRTTADLRRRLALGRRPAGPTGTGHESAAGPTAVTGPLALPAVTDPTDATGTPAPHARDGTPHTPGRSPRPWAGRARGYLALVLVLRPRPRSADTVTVLIVRTPGPLSERPRGSAPRRRRVQDRPGPAPDAMP